MEALAREPEVREQINGVSIRDALLLEETMDWLKFQDLSVYAWVVNDLERLNELVEWGVDGIVTDNLAILELLGDLGPLQLPDRDLDNTGGTGAVAELVETIAAL
jgi:glycerophosphoryl diester phosphodiesterase